MILQEFEPSILTLNLQKTTECSPSLCLQYKFIIGSETCLVHLYIEDTTTILHYDIPHHNMLYFNYCISDIPTGNNWTISACDGPLDNVYTTSCHNPAVILYGVNIINEISREMCIPSL